MQRIRALTIETTTRCNLACVMCPHGLPDGVATKTDTPADIIDRIIPSLVHVDEVQATGLGEPMLSPGFWRLAEAVQASEGRLRLRFHTNGIVLSQKRVDELSRIPLASINVSLDAATPETYRRVRGWNFEDCTAGVSRLVTMLAAQTDLGRPEDCLQISCVLMQENIAEAPKFVELAHQLGVKFVYFEHLVEPDIPKEDWIVHRDGFTFNYAEQSLLGKAADSDPHLVRAFDRAEALGIKVKGEGLLQSATLSHHEQRPCRYHGPAALPIAV